jgi:glycosyltransferase involved in cell wall biosynthesis
MSTDRPLRIAMIGTRGVPARYGGFETAVEEIGRRLVERGHQVTVYCRRTPVDDAPELDTYLGMDLVHLPAVRKKQLETLSHTGLSVGHVVRGGKPDVALVFNAANAPFLPALRARRIPVATHVDGLEWKRTKWGGGGRAYYRNAEALSVRWSDALIADAPGIADYYRTEFGAQTRLISYGAPVLRDLPSDRLDRLGLEPGRFHLVVARFEPENHVHLAVEGFRASSAELPLVVVGSAPYADEYTARITELAGDDPRIRLVGAVWDQDELDQLYAHSLTYIHGHSVGGTNPSLLRAIGAGAAVIAYDVTFNRGVLGEHGRWFLTPADVAREVEAYEADPASARANGLALQDHAAEHYTWDGVTDGYEALCRDLAAGVSQKGSASGRRRG